ncbi:LacI family transcriptional regulator [Glycomyces sp. TRM65418]|uniref:LacI family DNA-binding transcriptional regulator n=1 Tax=Glycomyces sp. TRM65418 TaxID=2867006 RepID=UPI001CE58031|nr:LacI family DNA-binding transcriptional regulator [Glycomyces sp. TRM65418]MCC3761503.1 LacI family transcriptional regulator [Glycomyces sp. TRM65418]QZD55601.1 LacI family transcriptional regulator [Glycomyces sp. TRM65418]
MVTIDPTDDQSPGVQARPSTVTLRDVADAAGVSKASASRALDPAAPYVSSGLRARVLDAARRLGYRPNASARATTTGATAMVAVLVSDIRDPYNAEIVHGVIGQAGESGLVATFAGTDHAIDDEIRVVRMMRSLRPHAMILTGARSGSTVSRASLEEELARYTREGGRVVIAGDDELPFDTAVVPRRQGASDLVAALFRLGYRSPALIRPDHDSAAARQWEDGIVEAARRLGMRIGEGAVVRAPMTRDGGYGAVGRLIERGAERRDVVLAATDAMAIGAMSAMRDAGLTPGSGIGVAGFDDVVGTEDVTPALTSVDLALAKVGAAAVELALTASGAERRRIAFEPRVVLRGTTPVRLG